MEGRQSGGGRAADIAKDNLKNLKNERTRELGELDRSEIAEGHYQNKILGEKILN